MEARRVGRYVVGPDIAWGGMASVHLGRMSGPGGFGKTVAMKQLHAQYAKDPEFVAMFHDEARVTSGLSHPNLVMTLDVLEEASALYLVMEYVHGASLAQIQRTERLPVRIAAGVIAAMLDGLHAAHEATDENGAPLGIIHRDVSPQNVLVSFQGVAKLADFGIAKAAGRSHSTSDGSAKGKIAYMAPEQVLDTPLTPKTDVYAAGVVLWEALTGKRLIDGNSAADNVRAVLKRVVELPSTVSSDIPRELDDVVMRALKRDASGRFPSAKAMGVALRAAIDVADAAEIGDWLRSNRTELLAQRDKGLADLQRAIGASSGTAVGLGPLPSSSGDVLGSSSSDASSDASSGSMGSGAQYMATGDNALPPRLDTRRWLPVIVAVLLLGIAGVALVIVALRRPKDENAADAASAMLATSTGRAATVPQAAPSASVEIAASSPSSSSGASPGPSTVSIDATATSTASPPVPSASIRPRVVPTTSPTSKRKCRIVPTMDSAGHTTFKEVCP